MQFRDKKGCNFSRTRRSNKSERCMVDQQELVRRILSGDKDSFRELVHDYQRLVSHFVFRMIPAGPDQEDLCQEVFIKVYTHLDRFRFDSKLSTWIARIAYNTCLNFLDKKKLPLYDDLGDENTSFEPAIDDIRDRPDFHFESAETGVILREEIDRLPAIYKTVMTLFHFDHMSYAEIADIMNMPEGTIKSYLFRARQTLKDRLLATFEREDL